jgi:hypothetical protein
VEVNTLVVCLVAVIASIATLAVAMKVGRARVRARKVRRLEPLGPPIEAIAASLRRLRGWLEIYDDPTPIPGKATKVAAATIAYDRVLGDACRALEITESLCDTVGVDREAERLRVEMALEDAGLVLRPRPRRRTGS